MSEGVREILQAWGMTGRHIEAAGDDPCRVFDSRIRSSAEPTRLHDGFQSTIRTDDAGSQKSFGSVTGP